MSFPSLVIIIWFIQVGIVSLNTLLHEDSPLVKSAVNVDDASMDAALSLSKQWVLGAGGCRASEVCLSFSSDALLYVLTAVLQCPLRFMTPCPSNPAL